MFALTVQTTATSKWVSAERVVHSVSPTLAAFWMVRTPDLQARYPPPNGLLGEAQSQLGVTLWLTPHPRLDMWNSRILGIRSGGV